MTTMEEMPPPGVALPERLQDFYQLPKRLQGLETKIVYLGVPDGRGNRPWWDLAGPDKGRQGVSLEPGVTGLMDLPPDTKLTRGPYCVGAELERLDVKEREINFAVSVGVLPSERVVRDSAFRYRMVTERWNASWSKTEPGYWCTWTRTHGWRYLQVFSLETKIQLDLDPVAYENNLLTHPMTVVALNPHFRKRKIVRSWTNPRDTSTPWEEIADYLIDQIIPGFNIGEGFLEAPNPSDEPVWPKFIVSSPGRVYLQDGMTDRIVELPMLTPQDGNFVLVDTDPGERTLCAQADPTDNLLFQIARNAQLLDLLFHDVLSSTLPIWRRLPSSRKPVFFESPIPPTPKNSAPPRVRVRHSHPEGTIHMLVPQLYRSPYG